jgi:carboxyl-terminal processing protease
MFKEATAHLQGQEYEGIGAWVDTTQDYLTIISPMPGSPAEKAGLKPNDKVIAIDGQDMTGIDGEVARQKVMGPKNSKVILTIAREGQEPFDVEIIREAIMIPSLEAKMLDNNIAYIQLFTFGDDTSGDLHKALEELMAKKPAGLILDLRNNGGGYLDTAIEVASEFINNGVIMYEQYSDGHKETLEAQGGGLATKIPMVVLINQGSASASEIVAGAIQDRGRGQLVGTTSFGKGSVQTYMELDNNEGAVRVTVARWLTPNGRQIHKIGLTPDVEVGLTEEDIQKGVDPQLQQAIQLLLKTVSTQ